MKQERNSSFETLRLLCIFGILIMHAFSGIDTSGSVFNTAVHVFTNSLFNTGVTCFILISGYFGIRFSIEKLVRLDCMVIFFTILGTIVTEGIAVKALIKSCIPVLSRQYWFITCYFALCILAPYLNRLSEKLDKAYFRRLLAVLVLLFSVIPTFGFYDIMQDAGKGLVQFIMAYLIGRYLALYENRTHHTGRLAAGALISTLCIFAADLVLSLHSHVIYTTFSRDCSLFILFTAVMLLLLFCKFTFTNKVINRISGDVLAIYVLDGFLRRILPQYFDLNAYASDPALILYLIAYVLLIMLISIVLNELRRITIGLIEPFLGKWIAFVLTRAGSLLTHLSEKILSYFI